MGARVIGVNMSSPQSTLFSQTPLLPLFSLREVFVAGSTLGNQILQEDWRRISILIQNVGSNPVYMRADRSASVGQGILLSTSAIPLQLLFKDVGTLVSRSWFVIADVMDSDLVIYETLYTPLRQRGELS